jgi:hypothetical protein
VPNRLKRIKVGIKQICGTSVELFPLPKGPLVTQFCIHQVLAGRNGVKGGEEEGRSGGVAEREPGRSLNTGAKRIFWFVSCLKRP